MTYKELARFIESLSEEQKTQTVYVSDSHDDFHAVVPFVDYEGKVHLDVMPSLNLANVAFELLTK